MIVRNAFITSVEAPKWEKTADGFLRTKARILKECVMPYNAEELGATPEEASGTVNMFVGMTEMNDTEALRTLEGCPIVTWDHNWLDPTTIGKFGKGAVAGSPRINEPFTEVDLLVTHPDAIADIEAGKIGEISAAYHAESVFEPGDYNGQGFDAKQVRLRYNHIAIIPMGTGRAGLDVKIFNKSAHTTNTQEGGIQMALDVKVRLRNTKRIINTDEEGAAALAEEDGKSQEKEEGAQKEAESAKSEAGEKGRSLEDAMGELDDKNGSMQQLQEEIEELKGELSVYKEKLDQLLSGDGLEEAAEGMNEEQGEADEILENCAMTAKNGEEKEKVLNCKFKDVTNKKVHRGTDLHRAVLTACGVKTENMTPPELKGAFKAQNQIVRSNGGKKVVSGTKVVNSMTGGTEGVQRTAHQKLGFK
jgi:hypothetical protein